MVDKRPAPPTGEQLDKSFQALSDGSRRKIIELLREAGELPVGTLADAFEMSLNGVSKHLKVLEEAGMVTRRVEGRSHFISVNWSSLQEPYQWLHFYHHLWSKRLDAFVDYVERASTSRIQESKTTPQRKKAKRK